MATTGRIVSTTYIGGIEITGTIERAGSMQFGGDALTLPAGSEGTLTMRTSGTAGVATLGAGHGIAGLDVVDVFWDGGLRYGVVIDAVDGNAVSFGGVTPGAGDDLPAQGTALVMTKQMTVDVDFDGDLLRMIAARANLRAHLDFQDAGGSSLEAVELRANEPWQWATGTGVANPLGGNAVAAVRAAAGTGAETTLKLGGLYEAVS